MKRLVRPHSQSIQNDNDDDNKPWSGADNCLASMDVDILWLNFGPAPVVGQTGRETIR